MATRRNMLELGADLEPVLRAFGHIPPALAGALASRFFQMMDHHRRAVIKYHQMPSGKDGMRMLGAGLHRYGRKSRDVPTSIDDAQGESFASLGSNPGVGRDFFKNLQDGADITSGAPMAVPIGYAALKGVGRRVAMRRFYETLRTRGYIVTKSGYLIDPSGGMYAGSGDQMTVNRKLNRNARTTLIGKLVRRRRQRKLLGFYEQFDRVWPKHFAKMESDIAVAMKAGGIDKLERRNQTERLATIVFKEAKAAYLGNNPGQVKDAVKVAKAAAAAVRARRVSGDD